MKKNQTFTSVHVKSDIQEKFTIPVNFEHKRKATVLVSIKLSDQVQWQSLEIFNLNLEHFVNFYCLNCKNENYLLRVLQFSSLSFVITIIYNLIMAIIS